MNTMTLPPPCAASPPDQAVAHPAHPAGKRLAITAEILYLANLTVLPVLALLILSALWRHHRQRDTLAANHLEQTLFASLWAAVFMLAMIAAGLLTGDNTLLNWSILLPALVLMHGVLILLGGVGLAHAIGGKQWRFPLLGPDTPPDHDSGLNPPQPAPLLPPGLER